MHPAMSVILLTTFVGVGQGLMVALFLSETLGETVWSKLPGTFYSVGGLVSFGFLLAGLVASFFHLGRPERFWRAAMKWRTSWLSREVLALSALIAAVLVYTVLHLLAGDTTSTNGTQIASLVGAALALLLFVCTGMIYACIKFFQQWATPLTVINYTLTGLASGFTLAAALAAFGGHEALLAKLAWLAFILTVVALVFRVAHMLRNRSIQPKSTIQSAIGVRSQKISQKHVGFMGGSFNTREFFHGKSKAVIEIARWIALVFGFLVPGAMLWYAACGGLNLGETVVAASTLAILGFVIQFFGMLFERWFFFADASHAQNLYYQSTD